LLSNAFDILGGGSGIKSKKSVQVQEEEKD